jgi:tripartite-type tricarboxylate transporter receptor subunit TctC
MSLSGARNMSTRHSAARRRALKHLAAIAGAAWIPVARGQSAEPATGFPDRPITIYCAFSAGGNTDLALRALAEATTKQLGRRILVENKPGAGGVLAAEAVSRARPDGYLLAQIPTAVFRQPHVTRSAFNPPNDMTWIINVAAYVFGVSVRADSPWKTWKDFVDYAKQNPGKINYASPGIGSALHSTMDDIAQREGIKWVQVPYKGTVEMLTALRQGEVHAYAGTPPWEHIKAGTFRPLVTWGEKPTSKYPNLPTLKQIYGIVSNAPWGIAGPKGIDPRIARLLHDALRRGMNDPLFVETIDRLGMEAYHMSSEDYARYARRTFDAEKIVVERLGLKP